MAVNIRDIYGALYDLIGGTVVPHPNGSYAIKDRALIVPLSSLSGEQDEWGGQFKDELITQGSLHAWMFTKREDKLANDPTFMSRGYNAPHVIQVMAFWEQRQGTATDNSDLDFNHEVDCVVAALNAARSTIPEALRKAEPFGMQRNYALLGKTWTHKAAGFFVVSGC